MTWTDLLFLLLALAAGGGLGLLYFGGLWLTVERLATARHPSLLFLGSFFGRLVVTLGGFFLVMGGRWERLVACLAGFILVRSLLLARWRPGPAPGEGKVHGG
jgi:F1F0 ATPase subunit 2